VIMSELELFFLTGALTQNFNIKTSHSDCSGHIEGDIMQNHEQQKKWKEVKNQDSMGKTNFFLSTLPFSPWVASATWLHVGAPQKIHEKWA
jgi:hypothetical protein